MSHPGSEDQYLGVLLDLLQTQSALSFRGPWGLLPSLRNNAEMDSALTAQAAKKALATARKIRPADVTSGPFDSKSARKDEDNLLINQKGDKKKKIGSRKSLPFKHTGRSPTLKSLRAVSRQCRRTGKNKEGKYPNKEVEKIMGEVCAVVKKKTDAGGEPFEET